MTRDYATKQPFKKRKPSPPTAYSLQVQDLSFPAWALLSIGFLIGALLMLGYHHWQTTSVPVPQVVASVPEQTPSPAPAPKVEVDRFDFYTLLPNMSVEVPEIEPTKENTQTTNLDSSSAAISRYQQHN